MLPLLGLLAILTNFASTSDVPWSQFFRQQKTPMCFPEGEKQCIDNSLYYFECCHGGCCMRLQPISFVSLSALLLLALVYVTYALVKHCCCRKPKFAVWV